MFLPSMSSRVKSGAGCPTLIRCRSVGLRSVPSFGPSWANAGEWLNDRTNNRTKIILSSMVPLIPLERFGLFYISRLFGLYNTMSEITICNGAKEIRSHMFKPADQRQPTRQHDFEAPALDSLDYCC